MSTYSSLAAIDSSGSAISYTDIQSFATKLKQILPPRSLVFLMAANDCGGLLYATSLILSRNVPLLLNPNQGCAQIRSLLDSYKAAFLCFPSAHTSKYSDVVPVLNEYGYTLAATGHKSPEMATALSLLLSTSGSTGSPKLVRHSYDNLKFAAAATAQAFDIVSDERALLSLPLYYTMGLSVAMSHLKAGATILLTDLTLTDPKFYSFMRQQRATCFTGVPYSYDILDKLRFQRMQMPDLRLLAQGGGKMPKELNDKFVSWCANTGRKWIATYGQTEGTARMSLLPPDLALGHSGSIGKPIPEGRFWLESLDGSIITEAHIEGELCYSGPNVTLGYATCCSDLLLGDQHNGILRTGDLATRDDDGCYYITGRKSRFLKLFGIRISLDDSQRIISDAISRPVACIGSDLRMQIYIADSSLRQDVKNNPPENRYTNDSTAYSEIIGKALQTIMNVTRLPATAFDIKLIPSLPLSPSGKILYSELIQSIA